MIVGGQDGSVTILVVAQLEDESMTDEETITKTAHYLKNLPSRRIHRDNIKQKEDSVTSKDDDETTSSLNTFEERMRDERRAEVRRRFR